MKEFRNIDDGKIYKTKGDEYYLGICPICSKNLLSNRYKDLYVSDIARNNGDLSIEITMEYCSKHGLFIRTDY